MLSGNYILLAENKKRGLILCKAAMEAVVFKYQMYEIKACVAIRNVCELMQ